MVGSKVMMVLRRSALAAAVVSAPVVAPCADIYRWVDDQGRTHIADTVPERYKSVATKLDSKVVEPTARQRAEALDRAAKDRAKVAELEAAARQAQPPASAASAAPPRSATRRNPAAGSECDRLWQEYHESQECFAPYQMGPTGIKAEAYSKCKEVRNPSQQCGPAKYISPQ